MASNPHLAVYRARLATRGLSVIRFDGHTLRLSYDPATDGQPGADLGALGRFATVELDAVDQLIPYEPELFPGVREIVVA